MTSAIATKNIRADLAFSTLRETKFKRVRRSYFASLTSISRKKILILDTSTADRIDSCRRSYFTLSFGCSGVSFSLCIATSAPFLPDKSMDPNVGPIRGRPFVSVTDIPTAIKPGKTSSV
jgi:hypothetical protein